MDTLPFTLPEDLYSAFQVPPLSTVSVWWSQGYLVAQTLKARNPLSRQEIYFLPSSPKRVIRVSLVSIHRNHLCLWRLILETMPRR